MAKENIFVKFSRGFVSFFTAISFIRKNKLLKYTIIPAILSLILGIAISCLFYFFLSDYLKEIIGESHSWWSFLIKYFIHIFI